MYQMEMTFTKKKLEDAVADATTIRKALQNLGVTPNGRNYKRFEDYTKQYGIDISHFKGGKGWSKGLKLDKRVDLDQYLTNQTPIQSYKLKLRLLEEGVLPHKCMCCGLEQWLDDPIPLELHHVDGNKNNNNLDNIELLCPNCHAQTENYRGKNKGAYQEDTTSS